MKESRIVTNRTCYQWPLQPLQSREFVCMYSLPRWIWKNFDLHLACGRWVFSVDLTFYQKMKSPKIKPNLVLWISYYLICIRDPSLNTSSRFENASQGHFAYPKNVFCWQECDLYAVLLYYRYLQRQLSFSKWRLSDDNQHRIVYFHPFWKQIQLAKHIRMWQARKLPHETFCQIYLFSVLSAVGRLWMALNEKDVRR